MNDVYHYLCAQRSFNVYKLEITQCILQSHVTSKFSETDICQNTK